MVAGHAAGRVADCLRRIWTDPEFDFGTMMQDPWGGIMADSSDDVGGFWVCGTHHQPHPPRRAKHKAADGEVEANNGKGSAKGYLHYNYD